MSNQTEEIQRVELELFKEFKRICDAYQLKYFSIGGTCIGAVRHKGFIPWDDDIDVAMPYQDYKKFQEVAQKELPDKYSLYIPKYHKHWFGNFIKLQNDCTTFIEPFQDGYLDAYTGINIDIMPIYGMPKGRLLQYFASLVCDSLLFFNERHRLPFCEQKSRLQEIGWVIDAPIRMFCPFNFYIEVIEKLFGKYSFDNSNKVIFGWRKRPSRFHKNNTYQNIFYYDDFKEMLKCSFEDTSIAIPCGYDRYLTMDFGEYMEPPIDKRIPGHKTKMVDLKKSYKDYIKEGILK